MIINTNIVMREIHGVWFLIDISDKCRLDECPLYEINSIGSVIWEDLVQEKELKTIVSHLKELINDDIPDTVLENDVLDFIEQLKEKGFVLEV